MTNAHSSHAAPPPAAPTARRHTLVVRLHDRPGALYRAVGLVRRRDYNVSNLVVGASERAGTSRMLIVVEAADVHQVVQQLTRLVDVVSVAELAQGEALVCETALAVLELAGHDATDVPAADAPIRFSPPTTTGLTAQELHR